MDVADQCQTASFHEVGVKEEMGTFGEDRAGGSLTARRPLGRPVRHSQASKAVILEG